MLKILTTERNADVNAIDAEGDRPLKLASKDNDVERIQWLLKKSAEMDLTNMGDTTLHTAILWDAREAARLLFKRGANPNAQNMDGCTPLFRVQSGEAIQLLLDHGANPKITDQTGISPGELTKGPLAPGIALMHRKILRKASLT